MWARGKTEMRDQHFDVNEVLMHVTCLPLYIHFLLHHFGLVGNEVKKKKQTPIKFTPNVLKLHLSAK